MDYSATIASELNLKPVRVSATIELLDNGATVPFVARYRKEMTGSMDEVAITAVRDRVEQLRELDKRREAILRSLDERELLTDELKQAVETATSMAELEDIYLPYKPKRRTRAMIARERGLEPLAALIFDQGDCDPFAEASKFIDTEKEVASPEEALAGARDIIAEWVNEDAEARSRLRDLYLHEATFRSKVIAGQEEDGVKYSDYFDWEEPLAGAPSHRILAMRRGENEGVLSLKITPEEDQALAILMEMFIVAQNQAAEQVREAVIDAYKRLLSPAMETEARADSKRRADNEAIRVFADNLQELIMAPPLGSKHVMAIDPGFRTGCKVVCLDRQGKLLSNTTVFPHSSETARAQAAEEINRLCITHDVEVIAIGNGTAGRETEAFVRSISLPGDILIEMVNESGASVYSASEVAREEFPNHDVTVRGAVSIGRRLMDPLAELVKIDPKAIGVGQYQHDVDQSSLRSRLDDTVMFCVNKVGVDVNTASRQLLTYVSGLGPVLARNIVTFRDENGPFRSRQELLRVPRLGPKVFEQAAGFMRIRDGENPLDASAVHPESYHIVETMARDCRMPVTTMLRDETIKDRLNLKAYVTDTVGLPTLKDILEELVRPGRDPRPRFEVFAYDETVKTIEDVKPGMTLPGIVTNVTAFGAFVDIGVHQDGLVHISEMADRYVNNPNEVVKVRQKVKVRVLDVDRDRNRIALSLRMHPKS